MADCTGFENQRTERFREFESHTLRHDVGVAEWLRNGLQIRTMGVRVSPSTPELAV